MTAPTELSKSRMLATVLLGMEQGVGPERLTQAVARLAVQPEAV